MKRRVLTLLLITTMVITSIAANGQQESVKSFPEETITITVPFGVGGNFDLKTRLIAKYMEEDLGVPVVVENKPGAAGIIGTTEYLIKEASAYELIGLNDGALILAGLVSDASFLPSDFEPIIGLDLEYSFLISNPSKTGIHDFESMVDFGKKNGIIFCSQGPSTVQYMTKKTMFNELGIKSENLQTKSQQESMANILGGHADVAIVSVSKATPYIESDELCALMNFGKETMTDFAGSHTIPSVTEYGKGLSFEAFNFIAVKKGVDPVESKILYDALARVFANADFQQEIAKVASSPHPIEGSQISRNLENVRSRIKEMNDNLN